MVHKISNYDLWGGRIMNELGMGKEYKTMIPLKLF